MRTQVVALAARVLDVAEGDIDVDDGRATARTGNKPSMPLGDLARMAQGMPGFSFASGQSPGQVPGLEHTAYFTPPQASYCNGTHVVEVEVDPFTGGVKLLDYTVAHDSGNIINPLIVDGQVQGGVAHGIGNALFEWMKYDAGAQPLTTSFQDYLLPAAPDVPGCRIEHVETPNPRERASPSLSTGNKNAPSYSALTCRSRKQARGIVSRRLAFRFWAVLASDRHEFAGPAGERLESGPLKPKPHLTAALLACHRLPRRCARPFSNVTKWQAQHVSAHQASECRQRSIAAPHRGHVSIRRIEQNKNSECNGASGSARFAARRQSAYKDVVASPGRRVGVPVPERLSSRYIRPMCGRFTRQYTWRQYTWAQLHVLYRLTVPAAIPNVQPDYNVCPTDPADVVIPNEGARDLVRMRWGLVPYWWIPVSRSPRPAWPPQRSHSIVGNHNGKAASGRPAPPLNRRRRADPGF